MSIKCLAHSRYKKNYFSFHTLLKTLGFKSQEFSFCFRLQMFSKNVAITLLLPCVCAKSLQSCPSLETLWTAACQAPLSMGFSRQEYWSGLPVPSSRRSSRPRLEPVPSATPALQVSLPLSHRGNP